MTESTVAERVIRVVADFKKLPPADIKPETTFGELGMDSLDGLNLIFELEEEFDLTIPDSQVQSMKSVAEIVEGIEMLLEAKAQGIDVNALQAEEFAEQQAKFREHKAKAGTAESGTAEGDAA
jgi:acyl carrier protein